MNKRLFLEAEFPFFMLDKVYPTTTQGNFRISLYFKEILYLFTGDSIMIARELFNKYRPTFNDTYLPRSSSIEQLPFQHYFN